MVRDESKKTAVDVGAIMKNALDTQASDIHLVPGRPPVLRLNGQLVAVPDAPLLTPNDTQALAQELTNDEQWAKFEKTRELDLSTSRPGMGRFRVNLYWQRGSVALALRLIPHEIPPFEQLGVPLILKKFAMNDHGLVLVTGPTGSGKSTTLAAMLDHINENRTCHIVTIEDPIEHLHQHKKSIVNQREMHDDTLSFHEALRHILRQDPNVILIGEMRDLETIQTALTIAETGHLVLATLHTGDAPQALSRIIDAYPPHQQTQARTQLSLVLICIMVQHLIRKRDGSGRVLAFELMVCTQAVSHLIRAGEIQQVYSCMQSGSAEGMSTLNACLLKLYNDNQITREDMMHMSTRPKEIIEVLGKGRMQ
jgi:twitching motility protein PilT